MSIWNTSSYSHQVLKIYPYCCFTEHDLPKRIRSSPDAAKEVSSPPEVHRLLKAQAITLMHTSEGPGLSILWHSFCFWKKLQSKPVNIWGIFVVKHNSFCGNVILGDWGMCKQFPSEKISLGNFFLQHITATNLSCTNMPYAAQLQLLTTSLQKKRITLPALLPEGARESCPKEYLTPNFLVAVA